MLNLSNSLSFLRAPLALLFLSESVPLRLLAICLAMVTDSFDGYLARKFGSTSQFGAVLDPAMDKFFVIFGLGALFLEGKLRLWQAISMLSRDFFLCVFGTYLTVTGRWHAYEYRSIRWGKASTALQFCVLIGLILGFTLPLYVFAVFVLFGVLAFVELCQLRRTVQT